MESAWDVNFCHFPADFRVPPRTYPCSLPHVLMHEYLRENDLVHALPYEAPSSSLRVIVLLLKKGRTYRTYRNPIVVIISVVYTYWEWWTTLNAPGNVWSFEGVMLMWGDYLQGPIRANVTDVQASVKKKSTSTTFCQLVVNRTGNPDCTHWAATQISVIITKLSVTLLADVSCP